MDAMDDAQTYLWLSGGGSSYPTPKPQAPLRPFPDGQYDRDLFVVWPQGAPKSRDFLRADLWGVTIPGLPWVDGASTKHPERFLSWFFDRYPREWQDRYLNEYAERGYTHLYLGVDDSLSGNNQSLDQYLATCQRIRDFGVPYIGHMVASKYFNDGIVSPQQYADKYGPILHALLSHTLADELVPAWEMNLVVDPGDPCIQIIKFVGAYANSYDVGCWLHFTTGYTSFFAGDGQNRYTFWDAIRGYASGINYQADSNWSYNELQGRISDTLIQQGGGLPGRPIQPWVNIRGFELKASEQFDNDHPDEIDACQAGLVACCTQHPVARVMGFGGGGRLPNGTCF